MSENKDKAPEESFGQDTLDDLFSDAYERAVQAMERYPQPARVPPIPKLGEEAGEVIQAANKYLDGKGSLADVRDEMVDNIVVLIRLFVEGDKTHGLPPVKEAHSND